MLRLPLLQFCLVYVLVIATLIFENRAVWIVVLSIVVVARFTTRRAIVLGAVVAIGVVFAQRPRPFYTLPPNEAEVRLLLTEGPVRDTLQIDRIQCRYVAELQTCDGLRCDARVTVSAPRCDLLPGDAVTGFAKQVPYAEKMFPGVPSLRSRRADVGLSHHVRLVDIDSVVPTSRAPIARALAKRRVGLETAMRDAGASGVLIAMITGSRGGISDPMRDATRKLGLSHLIAISGLHFGVVAAWIWIFVGWLVARSDFLLLRFTKKRVVSWFVLLAMTVFLLFIGAPASAVRAYLMLSVYIVAGLVWRRVNPVVAYSIAAVIALAVSPSSIRDVGFQFSFCAVGAILLALRTKRAIVSTRLHDLRRFARVSLAASFGTWPVSLTHFGQVSTWGPIVNLIVVPLFSLLFFPLVVFATALVCIDEVRPVGVALFRVLSAVFEVVLATEYVSPSRFYWTPGAVCGGAGIVIGVVGFSLFAFRDRLSRRGVIVAVFCLVGGVLAAAPSSSSFRVSFIPVGQGDATLVEWHGKRWLIDAGGSKFGSDPGARVVAPFLARRGISTLDAVIVTHDDVDHVGGVAGVARNVTVEATVRSLRDAPAVEGARFFQFVDGASKNERSLVVQLRDDDLCFLFTGDIEREAEAWLVEQNVCATVLKVAHHGSKTSTTEAFLDHLSPQFATISAGRHNRFSHPHRTVTDRLHETGVTVFETAKVGLVVFEKRGESIEIRTLR